MSIILFSTEIFYVIITHKNTNNSRIYRAILVLRYSNCIMEILKTEKNVWFFADLANSSKNMIRKLYIFLRPRSVSFGGKLLNIKRKPILFRNNLQK